MARGAIKFNLSSINKTDNIISATLSLKVHSGNGIPQPIELYEIGNEWNPDSLLVLGGVWPITPTGNLIEAKYSYVVGDILSWDVTSVIKKVIEEDATFNGFTIVSNTTSSMTCNLHSSESVNIEDRPKLVIETDGIDPITVLSNENLSVIRSTLVAFNLRTEIILPKGSIKEASLITPNGKEVKLNITNKNMIVTNQSLSKGIYYLLIRMKYNSGKYIQSIVIR